MKKNYNSFPYTSKNISNIIFVSGVTRSGKALVAQIIASLNGIEKVNVDFLMEQVNFLTYIKNIKKETAIYFLRRAFSILDYNLRIGREINFRKNDFTSIYSYRNPKKYFINLRTKEGDSVVKSLKKEKNFIPILVHHGLLTTNLFDAFDNFKFIEMLRNPIDTVFSWVNKDYGGEFYKSYRASILTLKYKKKIIPFYAFGWEKKYLKLNKYERIVEIFVRLENQKEKTLKKLSRKSKKNIFYLKLEDLYINPLDILDKLEKNLKKKRTKYTIKLLKKERLPRKIDLEEINIKKDILKKKLSSTYFNKLLLLEKKYLKKTNA